MINLGDDLKDKWKDGDLEKAEVSDEDNRQYEKRVENDNGIWETAKEIIAGENKTGKIIGFVLDTATFLAPHGSKIDRLRAKGKDALNLNGQKFNFESKDDDMDWFIVRLKEKSTWRGIVAVLTAVGLSLSPDQAGAVVSLGVAAAGAFEVFFKEPQSDDANQKEE